MSGNLADSAGSADSAVWREIDELLALTAAAAKTSGEPATFYQVFLRNLTSPLSIAAASVWRAGADDEFQLLAGFDWDENRPAVAHWPDRQTLAAIANSPRPLLLLPGSRAPEGVVNPLDVALLAGAIVDDFGRCAAVVLAMCERADVSAQREQTLELFDAFREIAADYQRRQALQDLAERQRGQALFDAFALRVHRCLGVEATAYAIVNEGRQLVGCDRLSLITFAARQPRVRAVSGVDALERRGAGLRAIESLATEVMCRGEPLYGSGASETELDAPDVAEAFRQQSLAKEFWAIPLLRPLPEGSDEARRIIGVLVFEWFTTSTARLPRHHYDVELLRGHSESAIAQALSWERIPGATTWRKLDPWFSVQAAWRWKRSAMALGAAAGLALLGWAIPADFTISAHGRMQPVEQRAIFAPSDAIVAEVLTDHNQQVAVGQPLVRLQSPALEFEATRIAGELATAEQQLRSVKAERWSAADRPATAERDTNALAAQEESLAALVANLQAQRTIVMRQLRELDIQSPLAGKVVTWRAADLLRGRPVTRGQELLVVANEGGPWRLEVDIPDGQFRHVLAARQASHAPLTVSFRLATEANVVRSGQLGKVSGATQSNDESQLVVPVDVSVDRASLATARTGAQATALVHCGRAPIAYVWFHEAWEWLQSRFW